MPTKVSARPAATSLVGSETIPIIQGGVDKRTVLGMGAVMTPEHYGCVGDGVTDDTTNFQACLTAGHKAVFAKNKYKITTTLQLAQDQILFGLPWGLVGPTFVAGTTPGIDYQGAANTVAIKNAAGATGNGVQDLLIHLNDNGSTAIQFSATYSNVVRRVIFTGTFRIGLLADDTYVCDFDTLVFNGCSVRTACLYIGNTNTCKIRNIHTSSTYPNDTAECMYGIAITSGYDHSIDGFVGQGPTIGIATNATRGLRINGFYSEILLCCLRIGNIGASQGTVTVTGGMFSASTVGHPQYAKRGPLIIHNAAQLSLIGPSFESTADNTTARGPWPIVQDSGHQLLVANPYHYGGAATTAARDLIYRKAAGSNGGITVTGSQYTANEGMELILKDADNYGSSCHGIRVNNAGTISATAYQPAVIFDAIDALLTTNLVTASTLVIA